MISFSRPYGWLSMRIRRSSFTTSRSFSKVSLSMRSVAMRSASSHSAQRQILRRHRFPEHRLVVGGVGVALSADRGEHRRVRLGLHVLRALEHQVLEQMREAGAARLLVLRSDVIRQVHVHDRRRVILGQDDGEPVGQRRDLILELRRTRRRGRRLDGGGGTSSPPAPPRRAVGTTRPYRTIIY